jgi:hypothetical protein
MDSQIDDIEAKLIMHRDDARALPQNDFEFGTQPSSVRRHFCGDFNYCDTRFHDIAEQMIKRAVLTRGFRLDSFRALRV